MKLSSHTHIGGFAAFVLTVFLSQHGYADEPPPPGTGHLQAISSGQEIPRGAAIALEPGPGDTEVSDDPLYAAARAAADQGLTRRGFRVTDQANVTLRIHIDFVTYRKRRLRPTEPFPGPPPLPGEDVEKSPLENQFELPLGHDSGGPPDLVSIELVLYRPDKPPIWSATIEAADGFRDPSKIVARLTKAALNVFGTDAESDFVINCVPNTPADRGFCLE